MKGWMMLLAAAFACTLNAAAHTPVKAGRWKTFTYDKPDKTPIVFGGWSRADGVKARDYCVYLDIHYADGSKDWAKRADWRQGTHGWERAYTVFLPKKPVAKIDAFVLNRNGVGRAEFRDVFLERREGKGERLDEARISLKPFADEDAISYSVFTGSKIVRKSARAASTIEFPAPPDGVTVWTASPMDGVTPLTLPPSGAAKKIDVSLARRERESAQLLVSCGADTELVGVTLEIDPLKDASGRVLDGAVKWERVGYIPRKPGYKRHPNAPDDKEMWLPDPLLPAAPFKVRRASTQGTWLTVYAAPEAKPGVYRSEVRVRQGGKTLAIIPLAATVLDFELGATFALETAFSLMDGFLRAEYPEKWKEMKRQAIDVMLDHRLNPDDISRTSPPEIDDLLHARKRGMNRFNILNIVPEPKKPVRWVCVGDPKVLFSDAFYTNFTRRLAPYLARLKEYGLDRMAYIYGFDERKSDEYAGIDAMWRKLKKDFPDLPVMTTTKMFKDLVRGATNTFDCITTDWYCPVSSDYDEKTADRLRALGKKVWWYTCCGPSYPYANMASLEHPAVEGRILLGYLTWLYRADGFLFWHVNNWRADNEPMDETDTYFPLWNTSSHLKTPGDGVFLYPGKEHLLPSIRLANIRDGEEDYEYLLRAEKALGRKTVESLVRPSIRSQTDFTRNAAELSALRERIGGLRAEYPDRWVHVRNDLMTDEKLKHFEDVVTRGAACGFNGILFDAGIGGEGVDADGWSGARLKRLEAARDFCRKAGMEIVPMLWSVGRANALVRSDPTLAEGQEVKRVPYRATVGRAESEASGVETMKDIFSGPFAIDAAGRRSKTVSLKVKPYRRYRVTARVVRSGFRNWSGEGANRVPVRTSFVFTAQPVKNGKGRNARENFLGRFFEDGTQDVMFEFLSMDAEEERISVSVNYRADVGKLEVVDVDVVEVGLRRPVVRQGCAFSVRNAETGREYVAGKDFIVPASDASPCAEDDKDVVIALPPGSAISPGTALWVDAYEPSRRNAGQVAACMANPGLYEYFDRTAPVIDRLFGHPKKWFLSMDEIRAGGSCGACKSSGQDLAHLLAQCLARQRDSIRKVRSDAIIYAWCDMYDPCVNAIPLKNGYAMCDGDYTHGGFLAPKDIVAVVWGGEKSAPKSLEYFVSNGVPTLYATYYDVFSAEHPRIRDAAAIANGAPGCRGLVYTTWIEGGRYDMLERFGEVMKAESRPQR